MSIKTTIIISIILNLMRFEVKKFTKKIKSTLDIKKNNKKFKIFDNLKSHQNNLSKNKISKKNKFTFFPFKNFRSEIFLGEINIGSNNQKLKVIFDTGSADIWINSELCIKNNCGNNKFNSKNSSSFKDENLVDKIIIGGGLLKGKLGNDSLKINKILINHQDFFQISSSSKKLLLGFDGIIGLSFKGLSKNNISTFLENLLKSKKLKNITFYLNYKSKPAMIQFGYELKNKNNFNIINIIGNKYWKIKIDDIGINGKSLNFCNKNNCYGIIDSGSSLISGPSNYIYKLIKMINWNLDCSNIKSLPPITIKINNKNYVLENKDYILMKNKKKCIAALSALDIPKNNNSWILGTIFLSRFKIIFDFENHKLYIR